VSDDKPEADVKFLLGHQFRRATPHELLAFGGSGPNTFIWSDEVTLLLYDTDEGTVAELPCDPPEGGDFERHWDVTMGDRP
jgi:sugar lactone lactonase YvrE